MSDFPEFHEWFDSYRPGLPVNFSPDGRSFTTAGRTDPAVAWAMADIAAIAADLLPTGDKPTSINRDEADFRDTCRHESAHVTVAYCLGWEVEFCDARAGQTKINYPDLDAMLLCDRYLIESLIAMAPEAVIGTYGSPHFDEDRFAVRNRSWIQPHDALRRAKLLMADPVVKGAHRRGDARIIESN